MVELTRGMYKEIKKMDREHLEAYLDQLYVEAYNSGVTKYGKELADRIDAGIRKTNGIGEKRYQELIANINEELNRPRSDTDEA